MRLNNRRFTFGILLFTLIMFFSCKENKLNVHLDSLNDEYATKPFGEIKDSLEVGRWLYRKNNKLIKEGRYEKGYKIGFWNYYEKSEKYRINWNVYFDENIKINYPKGWDIKNKFGYLFYALPNKEKKDFFLCIEHKKSDVELNLQEYLERVFTELKKKKKILNYRLQKIEYSKRTVYYLILKTINNKIENTYLALYTEDRDFIYDFTLNFKGNIHEDYYKIFGSMVYSFSKKTDKLFYFNDEILSINEVNID